MKRILFYVLFFFCIAWSAFATDYTSLGKTMHYVRAGATGSADGSDWTNAWTSIPSPLIRDHVYFIADGSYGTYTFDDAVSGTDAIYIVKATSDDHGTETGWDSSYGDGQALFTGIIYMSASYMTIDGQNGGGYDSWDSGHGIKIQTGTTRNIDFGAAVSNVILTHLEIEGLGRYSETSDRLINSTYYLTDCTISYCYLHDVEGVMLLTVGSDGLLIERNYFYANGANDDLNHREAWSAQDEDNFVFRFNWLHDISNTAFLGFVNGTGTTSNAAIYGNVFSQTESDAGVSNLIAVGSNDTLLAENWLVYNNTVVNVVGTGLHIYYSDGDSGCYAYNNMFVNNTVNGIGIVGTKDYNFYYGNERAGVGDIDSTAASGQANAQIGTSNPMTDSDNNDFTLLSATNAGYTLSSPYNTDMTGTIRGVDGTWDMGAFELNGGYSENNGIGSMKYEENSPAATYEANGCGIVAQ